jgi:putative oxidoreductase
MMERFLGGFSPYLYAVMRIVAGLLFACHGAQKLFGALGGVNGHGASAPLASKFGVAGIVEFGGGLLIALGLVAGFAAFIASGEMAVAYFTTHVPRGFWPIQNGGELAVLNCFVFLYIASRGAGVWSLDAMRGGAAARRADAAAAGAGTVTPRR